MELLYFVVIYRDLKPIFEVRSSSCFVIILSLFCKVLFCAIFCRYILVQVILSRSNMFCDGRTPADAAHYVARYFATLRQ